MFALYVLRTPYCIDDMKKGVLDGCDISTVQDKVPHLFFNNIVEETLLNCTFRSSRDNKLYDMWFLLQSKKIPKNVSCESFFIQIITINISDTLKG